MKAGQSAWRSRLRKRLVKMGGGGGRGKRARRNCRLPWLESLERRDLLTVQISINDVAVAETANSAVFTVSLSQSSSSTVTVDFDTADGTATTAGSDYQSKSLSLVYTPGQTTKNVSVTLGHDTLKESDETFKGVLSNPSGATISDDTGLASIEDDDATGITNTLDSFQKFGGTAIHAGNLALDFALPSGLVMRYNTLTDARPIIAIETVQPDDSAVPDAIQAELTFNGTTGTAVWYDTSGLSAGDPERFALQADATGLASGTYDWTLKLTEMHGSDISTRTFSGEASITNWADSPFGAQWWLADLDSLAITTDWATALFGSGGAAPYEREQGGGGGGPPPGGGGGGEGLVENGDGSWTYSHRHGGTAEFNSSGVLQDRIDRNGNKTHYSYTSGLLTSITDPFGREATLSYSSGLLDEITGFADEVTTFDYNASGELTSITLPDPDGAGSATSRR